MNNVELLKQGYADFAKGNVEAVLALFDPKIEWNESTGFPFIEGDGVFVGPAAVAENVFSQLPVHYSDFQIDVQEIFATEDRVVMVGYYKGTWKATGKQFKANATHVWNVKDGKLSRFFQAVDTAEIINP